MGHAVNLVNNRLYDNGSVGGFALLEYLSQRPLAGINNPHFIESSFVIGGFGLEEFAGLSRYGGVGIGRPYHGVGF